MKLATLRGRGPDGELVVVSRDLTRMARVGDIAPTLQAALDDWRQVKPLLAIRYHALIEGKESGRNTSTRRELTRHCRALISGAMEACFPLTTNGWRSGSTSRSTLVTTRSRGCIKVLRMHS